MTGKRGGKRPGAGRKRGSRDRIDVMDRATLVRDQVAQAVLRGESPLEYLLSVQRDTLADPQLRLDAARAAAPYVHRKMPTEVEVSADHRVSVTDWAAVLRMMIVAGLPRSQWPMQAIAEFERDPARYALPTPTPTPTQE